MVFREDYGYLVKPCGGGMQHIHILEMMALQFIMQEEDSLKLTNVKCHLCILQSTCRPLCHIAIHIITLQSNLVSTTLVYMTPSILRHIFVRPNFLVQNSLFYMTTTLDNMTFRACILSY